MHRCAAKSARHGGKRLAMQPNLTGRNPEVFFDKKVRSLAEGDQYLDPAVVEREIKNRVGGKSVSDKAFFPPKNTKHRCVLSLVCRSSRKCQSYDWARWCLCRR